MVFTAVACALDAPCRALADFSANAIDTYGSMAPAGPWTLPIQSMRFVIHHVPAIPTSALCTINKVGMAYEATRGIPTSVGIDDSDVTGLGTGSGTECSAEGNENNAPSISNDTPLGAGLPTRAQLSQSARDSYKGTSISNAGRVLQKHGVRPGSAFPKAVGNPAAVNRQAQGIVDEIIFNPATSFRIYEKAGYGPIIDAVAPDGRGVRFWQSGELIGLLEPQA